MFFALSRKAWASQEGVAEAEADISRDVFALGKEMSSLECLVSLCDRLQKWANSSPPRVHTFSICFCSAHCGQGKAPAPWHSIMSLMKAEASHRLALGVHLLLSFWCHPAKSPSLCGDNERRHMGQSWVTSEAPSDSQPTRRHVSECSQGRPSCLANHQQTKDMWTVNSVLCVTEVWGCF